MTKNVVRIFDGKSNKFFPKMAQNAKIVKFCLKNWTFFARGHVWAGNPGTHLGSLRPWGSDRLGAIYL